MGFSCPICSEKLEKLSGEAQSRGNSRGGEVSVSATPCGHIFHTYCIQKWLTGNLASSKQCPCCRKEVPKLRCLALFPNTADDSILDESFSQAGSSGGSGSTLTSCNHGELITSLKNQITRVENELKDKDQLYSILTSDYEILEERFRKEKMESDMWMMKSKQMESYKDLVGDYKKRAEYAEDKMRTYSQIENMLKGVEVPVNEDIVNYPISLESIRSLIELKHIMSGEIKSLSRRVTDLTTSQETIRSDKMKLKVQYEKAMKDLKLLQQICDSSQVRNRRSSSSSPAPVGPADAISDATPTAFKIKRRLQEPIRSAFPVDSPGVDSDIDLFPSAVKIKKKNVKKPTSKVEIKPKSKHKEVPSTSAAAASKIESKLKKTKFTCALSPIVDLRAAGSGTQKTRRNLNDTVILSDSAEDDLLDIDEDEDNFRIRGSVPGAPLPFTSRKVKSLQDKSLNPVLGGNPKKKKLRVQL